MMSEETIYETNAPKKEPVKAPEPKQAKKEPDKAPEPKKVSKEKEPEKPTKQKNVTINIGGAPSMKADVSPTVGKKLKSTMKAAGVAGAAASLFVPVQMFPSAPGEDGEVADALLDNQEVADLDPAPMPTESLEGHDMRIASGINDEMSFGEAFAAARAEVGAGGIFEWHGQVFGTYYGNEWNAMSPEEHDQYWADVHHTVAVMEEEMAEADNEVGLEGEPSMMAEAESSEEEPTEEPVVEPEPLAEAEIELDEDFDIEPEPLTEDMLAMEMDVEDGDDAEEVILDVDGDLAEVEIDVEDGAIELADADESLDVVIDEAEEVAFDETDMVTDEDADFMSVDETDLADIDATDVAELDVPDIDMPEDDFIGDNLDVDDCAITDLDPDIPIENNMDMGEFV